MISEHKGQGHPSMKSTQTDLVIDNVKDSSISKTLPDGIRFWSKLPFIN